MPLSEQTASGGHTPPVSVREAVAGDRAEILRLFADGRLGGVADDAPDIEDFESAYLAEPGARLWVAEHPHDGLVGMIAVRRVEDNVAELKRLRVDRAHRNVGIGTMLVERALHYCREQSYLKVMLDTFIDREPAIKLFTKCGFQLARTREEGGRRRLDFYLDLYREPGR